MGKSRGWCCEDVCRHAVNIALISMADAVMGAALVRNTAAEPVQNPPLACFQGTKRALCSVAAGDYTH